MTVVVEGANSGMTSRRPVLGAAVVAFGVVFLILGLAMLFTPVTYVCSGCIDTEGFLGLGLVVGAVATILVGQRIRHGNNPSSSERG